jgi:hypothetical protein
VIASNLDKSATYSISCGRNTEAYYGATWHGRIAVAEGWYDFSNRKLEKRVAKRIVCKSVCVCKGICV